MKRVGLWMIGIGLFITAGLLTVELGYAEEKEHEPTCTLNTLKGTYRFAATGYNITSTGPQPIAIVEVIDVNGDGTLNVPAVTLSVNGTILRFVDVGGSYTVNEDCTGTITFVTEVHGSPPLHRAALGAGQVDVSPTRSSSLPTRGKDVVTRAERVYEAPKADVAQALGMGDRPYAGPSSMSAWLSNIPSWGRRGPRFRAPLRVRWRQCS